MIFVNYPATWGGKGFNLLSLPFANYLKGGDW